MDLNVFNANAPTQYKTAKNELYKQPMFYAIGHFSRFVLPNSVRVDVQSETSAIIGVGFLRPDTSIALVLYNKSKRPAEIEIRDGNRKIELGVPAKSIHTVIYF